MGVEWLEEREREWMIPTVFLLAPRLRWGRILDGNERKKELRNVTGNEVSSSDSSTHCSFSQCARESLLDHSEQFDVIRSGAEALAEKEVCSHCVCV